MVWKDLPEAKDSEQVYMNNDSPEKVVDKILDTVLPKYSKGNA